MAVTADTVIDGRYRLVSKIGSGGMADVWAAEDEHLGRRVALKILHDRFAQDKEFVERFRREASSAAGLQHPNVVNVYDRGEAEGTYYIAMELLEGESLKDKITRGISIPETIAILRQILTAARFAHERGIIHRDFKPQNVIIGPDGKATVTDFGIAHAGASEITQTGSVMGTAHYLSPEQAQGLPVTGATDLYSIGVILYECLTGKVPFQAESSVAVALKQVSEAPRRPSALNGNVSPALDAVTMRALAKEPERRYEDAGAFIAALNQAETSPGQPAAGDTAAFTLPPASGAPPAAPLSDDDDPQRSGWSRRRIVLVVLALLLAGVAAFALTRPAQVVVPTVLGTPADSATRALEGAGFDVDLTAVVNEAPTNTVLEQDPTAGSKADKGSTIVLTVSSGPGIAPIPQVEGLSVRDATKRLQQSGFEVKEKQRFSDTVVEGIAIGTNPGPGTQLKRGSTVTLFVSKGADQATVPAVVGLTRDSARVAIQDAELVPEITERDDTAPAGQVIEQTPGAGSLVEKGSGVTIVVSTGRLKVKNVVGLSENGAISTLRKQGLSVQVDTQVTNTKSQNGKVIEQFPSGGSAAAPGDTVTITVGEFQDPAQVP